MIQFFLRFLFRMISKNEYSRFRMIKVASLKISNPDSVVLKYEPEVPESLAPSWILNLKWEVGSQIFVLKVWNIVLRWDDHCDPEAHRSDLVIPETSGQGIGKETFPVHRVQDLTTVRSNCWLRDEKSQRSRIRSKIQEISKSEVKKCLNR